MRGNQRHPWLTPRRRKIVLNEPTEEGQVLAEEDSSAATTGQKAESASTQSAEDQLSGQRVGGSGFRAGWSGHRLRFWWLRREQGKQSWVVF